MRGLTFYCPYCEQPLRILCNKKNSVELYCLDCDLEFEYWYKNQILKSYEIDYYGSRCYLEDFKKVVVS